MQESALSAVSPSNNGDLLSAHNPPLSNNLQIPGLSLAGAGDSSDQPARNGVYSASQQPTLFKDVSENQDRMDRGTADISSNNPIRSEKSDIKLDQTYLLCVDPEDKMPFQINMGTRMIIEEFHHDPVTLAIKGKIERQLYFMRELLDEIGEKDQKRVTPWAIRKSPQADQYRRVMVQSYHLEQESQQFQRYIDKSDLSENLAQNYKQDIKVFIIEGLEQFDKRIQRTMEETGYDMMRSTTTKIYKKRANTTLHRDIDINGFFILSRISLLQTADQVIAMIAMKLEKEMHLLIDSNKHAFILKFRNCDSYLYGPDQLVYFQDIRDALKYQLKIEIVVMVIEQAAVDSHFPPLLNLQEDIRMEEDRIANQIKRLQTNSSQKPYNPGSVSGGPGIDTGLIAGSEAGDMVSLAYYQSSYYPYTAVTNHHPFSKANSILPDLLRRKEQTGRMQAMDFKMQKYKRSSVFFWFKPPIHTPAPILGSDGRSIQDDQSSVHQYPNSSTQHTRMKGLDSSSDIQDPFKVSIRGIRNLGNLIQKVRERNIAIQKIEYRDTTTKNMGTKESMVNRQSSLSKEQSKSQLQPTSGNINTKSKSPSRSTPERLRSKKSMAEGTFVSHQDFQSLRFVQKSDGGDEHKPDKKTFRIAPRFIQIQAVIMMGSKCLSTYSLSQLIEFNTHQNIEVKLSFFKDLTQFATEEEKTEIRKGKKGAKKKELLKVCEIPSFARICFNVILVEENNIRDRVRQKRTGYILGSVSTSIFDFKHQLRFGRQELKLWPFDAFDPRVVCQGECNTIEKQNMRMFSDHDNLLLEVGFETKAGVSWGIKRDYFFEFDEGQTEEKESEDFKKFLENESEHLKKVKQMIDRYPQEDKDANYEPSLLFKYRHYVDVIPAFIKSVNFADPSQVAQCYSFLESNEKAKNLKPEEALALLDSQFGDEFVRIYALQRVSRLDDYILALYMPQLVQALKYELFHESVLSAFLLERAIKNTSVIGHAFYWSIKASMHSKMSFERYYLILERFLMCCGSFKFRLYNETVVTRSLMDVSSCIQNDFWLIEGVKRNKEFNEQAERDKMNRLLAEKERDIKLRLHLICTRARYDMIEDEFSSQEPSRLRSQSIMSRSAMLFKLEQQQPHGQYQYLFSIEEVEKIMEMILKDDTWQDRSFFIKGQPDLREEEWMREVFYFPIEPRKPISGFDQSSGFFVSKKIPLRIVAKLSEDRIHQSRTGGNTSSQGGGGLMRKETLNVQSQFKKQNIQSNKVKVMFKYGDDLRQDNLVLQFFKLMDRLWMENGLNLEMNAYNVIETGNKIGFIEFVDNAEEVSNIHKRYGNFKGPFLESSVLEYVEDLWSQEEHKERMAVPRKEYHANFIKSVAGQCAATYILGIGDRHTGNYMLQKYTGRFFHIDFGHFLGHFKKKFGIRRDVEPFIFSREMCHFITHFNPEGRLQLEMEQQYGLVENAADEQLSPQRSSFRTANTLNRHRGSQQQKSAKPQQQDQNVLQKSLSCLLNRQAAQQRSAMEQELDIVEKQRQESALKYFEEQGSQAYNILRKNAHTLINLLTLMIAGDIVQLNDTSIRFLIDRLKLSKTDEEASADFKNQIQSATKAWTRRVDSVFHNLMDELKKGKKRKEQTALTNFTEAQMVHLNQQYDPIEQRTHMSSARR